MKNQYRIRNWSEYNAEEALPRDENLRAIRQVGRKKWKKESG